jgi:protein tyrosine phosphatase (PTP) superfamily phosphohydrolase (DUF442 family)
MISNFLRQSIAVVILNAVLAPCLPAAFAETSTHCRDIPNFQKVCKELYRGAAPSESQIVELSNEGVKTIVDLRMSESPEESQAAQKAGMKYLSIPMGFGTPSMEKINQFLAIATDPKMQPVFVHCRQGADRTGVMVGIYRMMVNGWTFDQTYAEMREHHFKPWLQNMKHTVAAWEPSASPTSGESAVAHNPPSGSL